MRPELTDGTILLRVPQPIDVPSIFEAIAESLPELCRFLPWAHPAYTSDETGIWVEQVAAGADNDERYPFMILDPAGHVLGVCSTGSIDRMNLMTSVGYWVRATEANKGIATRSLRLITQFCLSDLKLERVELLTDVENAASKRVAEKAGFTREGILRNRIRHNDATHDAVVFSVTSSDR